jgi:hypothetical protein
MLILDYMANTPLDIVDITTTILNLKTKTIILMMIFDV